MASATTNSSDNNRKTQSNKEDHSTSTIPDLAGLTDGAIASIEAEKRMGILESFRLYPKAVAWSIVLSAAIVMDGYDTMLFGNLLAFPTFQKQFGRPVGDETYQITAVWQLSLSNSTNVGGILGLFLTGVLRFMLGRSDEWTYKVPFALQWIWLLLIIAGCIFAPESPWWLVRKGRIEDARRSLERLTSSKHDPNFNADENMSMMIQTNNLEKEISSGIHYWDCFKDINLRRTEITCSV
ncbi:MAG: hypothetical protein M1834_008881 [Cirrosporium novae-zelandiae]|nr:MAG: hypothetical protein M1834_008881 [Cirrosporium novae-zelandiae]